MCHKKHFSAPLSKPVITITGHRCMLAARVGIVSARAHMSTVAQALRAVRVVAAARVSSQTVPAASPELLEKAARIQAQLSLLYPPPLAPPLHYRNVFEFLVAVLLSAQTTDRKVNEVTPALFAAAPTPQAMAALPVETIQGHIKQLGLSQAKAGYLSRLSQQLVERHGSEVPSSFQELEALAGVGHKTASVLMAQAFGVPAFPVDTHILRLALRWGLCTVPKASVAHVERDLKQLFPEDCWKELHLQLIFFGREHCAARGHAPGACPICSWAAVEGAGGEEATVRGANKRGGGDAAGKGRAPKARRVGPA